jgi:hypothetical protein
MGLFDWLRRKPPEAPRKAGLEPVPGGFVVHDGAGGRAEVRFDDVHEVFAFKRPQGATKYLCLGIQTEFEGEPVVLDEGMDGFRPVFETLASRFQLDETELQLRVMRGLSPGPNPTRLWRKRGDTFKRESGA